MTNQSLPVSWMCRIYAFMLYTYPRRFRLEYGGDMRQMFRDQCHDAKGFHLLRVAAASGADWAVTTLREGFDAIRSKSPEAAPRGFIAEWAITALIYLFVSTTLVQAYVVPTGSMEGNLRVGDHMLVDRVTYAKAGPFSRILPYRDVQRGDIVAFLYPENVRETYVKRVIGLPGDHIRLSGKRVIRNGQLLVEPYTQHISPVFDGYRDNFPQSSSGFTTPRGLDMLEHHVFNGEVVVPPDSLFVMGDNRDNSADSRYWGFVPRSYVVGKPLLVYWSFDAPTSDLEEWNLRHALDVAEHFLTKTRWERTMLIPRSQPALSEPLNGGGAQ